MTVANAERCEQCGANLALVGRVHRCNPRPAGKFIAEAGQVGMIGDATVTKVRQTSTERVRRHRAKNPEHYRAYMRDFMRRKRAKT